LEETINNNNNSISPENIGLAWEEIYISEGSDWFWWFGKDHSSANDYEFDILFRKHLMNVYKLINKKIPDSLTLPIKEFGLAKPYKEPAYLIQPTLDGIVTNYYEWLAAGQYEITGGRGAMHQMETMAKSIYYGFDLDNLFVRIDGKVDLIEEFQKGMSFCLQFFKPQNICIELCYKEDPNSSMPDAKISQCLIKINCGDDNYETIKKISSFAVGKIIEIGIPFEDLQVKTGENIEFMLIVYKNNFEIGRFPEGLIKVVVPTKDFDAEMWSV
jgi:hypothetical protein